MLPCLYIDVTMRRVLHLRISYDGTTFAGWQRQVGAMTIQEALERAIYLVSGEQAVVHGAGRTDSGVHAIEQSALIRSDSSNFAGSW